MWIYYSSRSWNQSWCDNLFDAFFPWSSSYGLDHHQALWKQASSHGWHAFRWSLAVVYVARHRDNQEWTRVYFGCSCVTMKSNVCACMHVYMTCMFVRVCVRACRSRTWVWQIRRTTLQYFLTFSRSASKLFLPSAEARRWLALVKAFFLEPALCYANMNREHTDTEDKDKAKKVGTHQSSVLAERSSNPLGLTSTVSHIIQRQNGGKISEYGRAEFLYGLDNVFTSVLRWKNVRVWVVLQDRD